MSRVFAVQNPVKLDLCTNLLVPKFDTSGASTYGEFIELLSPSAQPFTPDPLIAELRFKLRDYRDEDWILCLGNPILIGWSTAIASWANAGRVNMLQWHRTFGYQPIKAALLSEEFLAQKFPYRKEESYD